mgnify:CR=1 FL=1
MPYQIWDCTIRQFLILVPVLVLAFILIFIFVRDE